MNRHHPCDRLYINKLRTKAISKPVDIPRIYPLLLGQETDVVFTQNPNSVFVVGNDRLVVCRIIDNSFAVLDLSKFSRLATILFHQVEGMSESWG